jgi:hypothetical protein
MQRNLIGRLGEMCKPRGAKKQELQVTLTAKVEEKVGKPSNGSPGLKTSDLSSPEKVLKGLPLRGSPNYSALQGSGVIAPQVGKIAAGSVSKETPKIQAWVRKG